MAETDNGIDSKLIINSAKLMSASGIGQIVSVAVYPLLTRLYSPGELGNLSLFLAVVGVGAIIASAQYENAVVVEKDSKNAAAALDLCIVLNIMLCAAVAALNAVLTSTGAIEGEWSTTANLIAPLIFLSSLGYVLSYWWNRIDNYGKTALYNVVHSLTNNAFKVVLGFMNWHKWGLIISAFIGQAAGVLTMVLGIRSNGKGIMRFSLHDMKSMAMKHRAFAQFTLPHKLINVLTANMPIFILSAAFDMVQVGFFALALNVAMRPMWALARSLNQVLFQRVGENERNGVSSAKLASKLTRKLVTLSVPAVVILWMTIPPLTKFLFGEEWSEAGEMLRMMLPWLMCSFIAMALNFMPSVYGKQRQAMRIEIAGFAINIAALIIGSLVIKDVMISVSILSMVNTLYSVCLICWYQMLAIKRKAK